MPNTFFRFKQFTVHQDQCSMKVCTDACILGAWFAAKIPSFSMVLDIGSGTGLLMLMLAQKGHGEIQGIELDFNSFKQQKENIFRSRWKERLNVFPGDARVYSFPIKYDFIISNPPFFEDDLLSGSDRNNIAKHDKGLTLEELLRILDTNLSDDGTFGVLLPYHRTSYFETLSSQYHFGITEKLLVRQTAHHPYFRSILHFTRNKEIMPSCFELAIQNERGEYSPDFIELMKDYYLFL